MKRILHITNTDVASDSRIQKELSSLLSIDDAEIFSIGVPSDEHKKFKTVNGSKYLHISLLSHLFKFLPRPFRYFLELIEFTFKAVSLGLRIHSDVIHCHDTFALPSGWILKTICKCKLVYDAHELESNKNGQNFILSQATLVIERLCWNKIDLLVSVSESILDWYIQKLGYVPALLVLNSPIVRNSSLLRASDDLKKEYFHIKYSIPDGDLIFVYLGILGTGRGIELCLEAFAYGPSNAHVVFIGYGDLQATITEYANRYNNIHFHAAVQHDQVVSLVSHADYGLCFVENVSLSDYYCLPNKLFEYAFARLPVLASNFPEIERVVTTFSLGVCCAPNSLDIRMALAKISIERPSFTNGDISILSWENQGNRLVEYYKMNLLDAIV